MGDLLYVCRWRVSQPGTPGRQKMLGTGPGHRQLVSNSPGVLSEPVLLQDSVSLNISYWVEPHWRFSSVYSNRTLWPVETHSGQNRAAL